MIEYVRFLGKNIRIGGVQTQNDCPNKTKSDPIPEIDEPNELHEVGQHDITTEIEDEFDP